MEAIATNTRILRVYSGVHARDSETSCAGLNSVNNAVREKASRIERMEAGQSRESADLPACQKQW